MLFGYCTEILRFSEAAAWNRIKAARSARKFPVVLDLLADGSVNLTTIRLLSPHLTPENHRAILAEATGMTRRQVDKIVARFVAKSGRRCTERSFLEYHHEEPFGVGGEATVDNISLRCREHNEYESELIFGPYEPQRLREASPAYCRPFAFTGPGTSKLPPREMLEAEREAHI